MWLLLQKLVYTRHSNHIPYYSLFMNMMLFSGSKSSNNIARQS